MSIQPLSHSPVASPTSSFAQSRGAFNAERQTAVTARPAFDTVTISPAAISHMSSLQTLQRSSRVGQDSQIAAMGNIDVRA